MSLVHEAMVDVGLAYDQLVLRCIELIHILFRYDDLQVHRLEFSGWVNLNPLYTVEQRPSIENVGLVLSCLLRRKYFVGLSHGREALQIVRVGKDSM